MKTGMVRDIGKEFEELRRFCEGKGVKIVETECLKRGDLHYCGADKILHINGVPSEANIRNAINCLREVFFNQS